MLKDTDSHCEFRGTEGMDVTSVLAIFPPGEIIGFRDSSHILLHLIDLQKAMSQQCKLNLAPINKL